MSNGHAEDVGEEKEKRGKEAPTKMDNHFTSNLIWFTLKYGGATTTAIGKKYVDVTTLTFPRKKMVIRTR